MQKGSNRFRREYRVLAIAIAFFAVGLYFFLSERPWAPAAPAATPAAGSGMQVAQPQQGTVLGPSFANYPAYSQFRTFTYDGTLINGTSSLVVTSTCSDAYVALLAFPASVDYRQNPARAVYNRAFACAALGTVMTLAIAPSDLGAAPSGTYYYFTADQGTSTVWYNPK